MDPRDDRRNKSGTMSYLGPIVAVVESKIVVVSGRESGAATGDFCGRLT
jgi:hypothetical protein